MNFFLLGWLLLATVLDVVANHVDIEIDEEFKESFEDTEALKIDSPTDLEFTPDGKHLFVTQKEGKVWVVDVEEMDKGNAEPKLSFQIPHPMCFNGARGLLGIGIHPGYPVNRWVYLFYNFDKYDDCAASDNLGEGPVNRLSRFELNEDNTIDEDSEVVFFTTPRLPSQSHNSGDIAFGKDGYLYITVGDAGTRTEENDDGVYFPQALDRLMGKIVRLTDTGDIPEDNPYTPAFGDTKSERCNEEGTSSKASIKCQEIYATGLRNPFRFAMDPNAQGTRFFINEVGRQQWERILPGGDNYAGANYGYPFRQGPCEAGTKIGEYKDCGPSEFVDPVHWYEHDEEDGGACTGGAFVPDDIGWPESFKGSYLYAEYAYGGIYRITPGGKGCPYPECDPPISDFMPTKKTFSATKKVVSMHFGPHNGRTALYYLTRDHTGNRGHSAIFRIAYTGSSNRSPKPQIVAEPTVGFAPLTVTFDATQSIDPDGDSLTYQWDFDGDGVIDSSDAKTSFIYTKPGTYAATLIAKDGNGGSSTTEVRIDAGNTPPIPKIISPAEGSTFAVGEILTLVGSATDHEDGELFDTQLTWEVRQHHNNHYHPFLDPTEGNNFDLWPAPPPEDFDASLTSYLSILLTATDSTGLSSTTSLIVKPKIVDIVFDSNPPGLHIVANGDKFKTPATVTTWENHRFKIEAPTQSKDDTSYGFKSWSDGNKERHEYVVPASAPEPLVADFEVLSPVPQIMSPLPGTTFAADDHFKLVGSATDGAGNELPDSSLTWEIRYRSREHSEHNHLLKPTQGNNVEINGKLEPEDLTTAKKSYLEIFLTATDAAGLSTTTSLALKPRKVDVDFDTVPSGLDLILDGETFKTPVSITTWENHKFNIRANPQTMDGDIYKFAQWSDGGKRSHKYKVTASSEAVVADFELALAAPKITSIEEGSSFAAGEIIKLAGYAKDKRGETLPLRSLTWEVRLYNEEDEEYRTVLKPTKGNNIQLDAPKPADFNEAATSYLEILLTTTDKSGLSSTESLIMEPKKIDLTFETEPSGFFVIADGHQIKTPATITTWKNHRFKIEAPTQRKRGITYYWNLWSDGGAASHEYVAPAARRGNKAHTIKAVFGEQKPEEPATVSSMLILVLAGVAAAVAVLVIVVFILLRKKKKGSPTVDVTDNSAQHNGDGLKNGDMGVLHDADDSTLGDNVSQDDIEAPDNSGIMGSNIDSNLGSSNASIANSSSNGTSAHAGRKGLSRVPSYSSCMHDGGNCPDDEDSTLSPSVILGTDQDCGQSLSGDTDCPDDEDSMLSPSVILGTDQDCGQSLSGDTVASGIAKDDKTQADIEALDNSGIIGSDVRSSNASIAAASSHSTSVHTGPTNLSSDPSTEVDADSMMTL